MKVLIMTDLEGVSGVDTIEAISEVGTPKHRFALERLMLDLNASIDGAIKGGASTVYVRDGHGGGNNFLREMLDPRAIVAEDSESWQKLIINRQIDGYMKIGAHAMAGTINGFLDHTQSSKNWFNYIVNGRKHGEIGQGAIFAGTYDIPVIMISGDEAACVEAKSFLGDIECAVVKYGAGRNNAKLVDLEESLQLIKRAAKNCLKLIGKIRPYKLALPLEIKLESCRSDYCDEIIKKGNNVERIDARTVRKIVHNIINFRDILF